LDDDRQAWEVAGIRSAVGAITTRRASIESTSRHILALAQLLIKRADPRAAALTLRLRWRSTRIACRSRRARSRALRLRQSSEALQHAEKGMELRLLAKITTRPGARTMHARCSKSWSRSKPASFDRGRARRRLG